MEKNPSVTIGALVFNKEKRLLLLRSHKWHGRYIVPCGHVNFGEKLIDAVQREVKEETDLNVKNIKFLTLNELINSEEYHDKRRHFISLNYTCETSETEITLNDEAEAYEWVSPKEALNKNIDSLTKSSIEKYLSDIAHS